MRKEIRSKSKRKWVVGGALFFGGIALLTTGFATWVVGLQVTSQDASLGVQVDTAENKSQVFEAVLGSNSGIHLTEYHKKGATDIVGNESSYPNENPTDFSITFSSLTITQGSSATKPTYFEVGYSETALESPNVNINNKITVASGNNKIGKTIEDAPFAKAREDGTYTYIDINIKRIFLTLEDYDKAKKAREDEKIVQWLLDAGHASSVGIETAGYEDDEQVDLFRALLTPAIPGSPTQKEQNAKAAYDTIKAEVVEEFKDATHAGGSWTGTNYSATNVELSNLFKWGTYFGGESPCTYYNAQFAAGKIGSTYDDVGKVYDELNAMYEAFNVANGFVVIKLSAK